MSEVIERLRAANPLPECPPLSIAEVWRRVEQEEGSAGGAHQYDGPNRRRFDVVWAAVAVAVTLAVAAVALTAGGHDQRRIAAASRPAVPAAARPLARILGVLRAPQTPADRAVASEIRARPIAGEAEPSLVRLAAITPWGQEMILVPQKGHPYDTLELLVSRKLRLAPVGSARHPRSRLIETFAGTGGAEPSTIEAGLVLLSESGGTGPYAIRGTRLFTVVPDGVAKVAFVSGSDRTLASVRVHNNVAYVWLGRGCCSGNLGTRWYAADGQPIKQHVIPTAPVSSAPLSSVGAVLGLVHGIPQSGSTLGDPKAPVTVDLYSDLESPISRDLLLGDPFRRLLSTQVRTGKVRIVFRSLCVTTCNVANARLFVTQQAAAYAAGEQDRFWNYALLFYDEQGPEEAGYVTPVFLGRLATQVPGLNVARWKVDRSQPSLGAEVIADEGTATASHVEYIPTLVAHGARGTSSVVGYPSTFYTDVVSAIARVEGKRSG